MPTRVPHTPALAALVILAGLGAWMLAGSPASESPPPGPLAEATRAPNAAPRGEPATAPVERAPRPTPAAPPGPSDPSDPIPRVLPADAAIEDLRDALALPPDAREAPLTDGLAALTRIAARDPRILSALHAAIDAEDDPLLRAIAQVGLGPVPSEGNRTWLRTRLGGAEDARERLGALVALTRQAAEAAGGGGPPVRSEVLAGLRYVPAALRASATLRASVIDFLASVEGAVAREALPILRLSVRDHVQYASALVGTDGEACLWLRSLPDEARAAVLGAALAHTDLPDRVRTVLEPLAR